MQVEIGDLLRLAVERQASDLHLVVGRPPQLRIDGTLMSVDAPKLIPSETHRLVYSVLNDVQKQRFEEQKEIDFSLSISNLSRFRVNAHLQRNTVAAAFRLIPERIRTFEELNLPKVLGRLSRRPYGLVLVTGPTGSGKSTTLAAMIDVINNERACHIITVEDPIEYLHPHKKALVEQRELAQDTHSFTNALKYVLRQDPDVILIGEMRDLETIGAALTAAETGHLVLTTLHTNDVVQTIDRVIDVFPEHQQGQVRVQLASCIEGILCQRLLPSARGHGREIVIEIMMANDAVRSQIREGKTHQVYTTLEASAKDGMITMDRALEDLYRKGRITMDVALSNARKPKELERKLY
ncbi:type IV pilus twitching motility protein PilT [Candidatus Sumerlaeota bacterium]|nr:type IV pilus twitching motility protein PilT [Candidatus Sumerlaeota bacterium]